MNDDSIDSLGNQLDDFFDENLIAVYWYPTVDAKVISNELKAQIEHPILPTPKRRHDNVQDRPTIT